ncbi:zinc metalloproteinase-disintegrin-like batroxstatin-1 isoform X2 [Carcharodon carcharias]|uniref:zinc metalloproteinase-disintegrin-like batroxstatin-1 isoform X2 n=1 Tax=Carcharodon carcharias TaxID=13397 RepID=UPI001B7F2F64|nr:zinc metalloproteinase-disintegrin-like batroxstatin-1 isoform X2 [Carcharodon carcharias]
MFGTQCLLCFLLFCSVVPEFVTSASKLPDVQSYQVVKPRRFHAKQKRESEGLYPPVVQFEVTVEGKTRFIHLEKNQQLIAKNYSETYYLENGTEVTSTPLYPDHCYYHGHIEGEGGSSASFSTCDGFSGYLRTNGQRYLMEPLKDSDSDEHALYKYEELRLPLKTCGVVNSSEDSLEPKVEETFSSDRERSDFLKSKKYIEMYVVADHSEFQHLGSLAEVRKRVFEAVNHINLLYKPLRTHVALIGLEIWSNGDQILVQKEADKTLTSILKWRRTKLLPRKQHDNIQFITYLDFIGDTIGLAQVSAMCTGGSGAINQDHAKNVHGVASTMAHEMGHNLGMNHDDNTCSCNSNTCIMSPVLSSKLPTEFSSCSHQHFQSFVLSHTASCLRDIPKQDEIVSNPICGNRFLEKGEECDCGSPMECQNQCCDARTCRRREAAQCADGACCQDCKFKAAGSLCRRVKDDCDLAETCDGKSGDCPKDMFLMNGTPCQGNTGICYNGKCPSHQEQCVSLWGTGAQPGPEYCFRRNTVGDQYSHCQKTTNGYEACKRQDIMCGQLNCVGGNRRPPYNSGKLTFGNTNCQVVLYQDGISRGLVQSGTKCGDNKVCNHLRECQFQAGFSPELSSTFPSYAIIIIVLIVVLLIGTSGIATFVYMKRRGKTTAIPRTLQPSTSGLSNPVFTDSAPATPLVSRLNIPQGPVMVAAPPPASSVAASAPYPPRQAHPPQMPPSKPVVPSGKPAALRAPLHPPGFKPPHPAGFKPLHPPGFKPPQPPGFKPLQPPAVKPPHTPVPKVLMPPTKPRN